MIQLFVRAGSFLIEMPLKSALNSVLINSDYLEVIDTLSILPNLRDVD